LHDQVALSGVVGGRFTPVEEQAVLLQLVSWTAGRQSNVKAGVAETAAFDFL
jgi:hypothetical protein